MSNRFRGIVVSFHGKTLLVKEESEGNHYECDMPGRFKRIGVKPLVGDIVEFTIERSDKGWVQNVLNRRNELSRPKIANVDQVILVTTLAKPEVSYYIVDKFLVLAEFSGLPTIIVLNKLDLLVSKDQLEEFTDTYSDYYTVIPTSAKTGENLNLLIEAFRNKVSTMAGVTGVGKSSLLNGLNPGLKLKTTEISQKLGRGKHTTTRSELLEFNFGGYIADTPGFSTLELPDIEPDDLQEYFVEINAASEGCAFSDCSHINEPGCHVKELLKDHLINHSRYDSYVKIYNELKQKSRKKR
ncbi:MAG: ribosome small subunit-dependent GTPase A [Kosmotogaceae bacterium]